MSEHRNKVTSLTRSSAKEKQALGKENVFVTKQSNKLAGTDLQKIIPRKRFFSADLDCGCNCNCGVNNDVALNEIRSSAKKVPFRIHFDGADNDLIKAARFRKRISEYDTHRVEKLQGNKRDFQNKFEKTERKQQREVNTVQDSQQKFKENKASIRNSAVSGSKPIIKSIRVSSIPENKLRKPTISNAKSLVDLSKVNKPSSLTKRSCDTVKLNVPKSTPIESNLAKKRSLSSSSITKSNNLVDRWNRVNLRSRSCSNRPLNVPARKRVTSTGSTNEIFINLEQEQTESDKLGGHKKNSLISGSLAVFSQDSTEKEVAKTVEDHQIQENTKTTVTSNYQVTSTSIKQKSNNQKEQETIDVIPEKVQAKVENDLNAIKQNTDFSAYLLYNTEYLIDLLTVEEEKENSSPKLSPEFIDEYINSEPRKIVVAFLIRLSTHCRYPSYILYQAVQILDIIIDRISITGSDLKLAAVTALWIVLKKHGNFNKIPSAKSMLEIAQNLPYENVNVLINWERKILSILNFNITFSDPFSIFVFYVINYNYDSDVSNGIITKIYYCGGYIIDLTLLDVKFSYTTSNQLGLATAELVMTTILDDETNLSSPRWHHWRQIITNGVRLPISYYDKEIDLLRATMITHILESAKKHTKEEIVRKRYSHNRYGNISEFFLNKIKKLPKTEYSICM